MKALEAYRNDDLSRLVRNYCVPKPPTRKDALLALLEPLLSREHLRRIWPALDPLIQAALSETAWSDDGRFRRGQFKAKYGALPPKDIPDRPPPEPKRPMYY